MTTTEVIATVTLLSFLTAAFVYVAYGMDKENKRLRTEKILAERRAVLAESELGFTRDDLVKKGRAEWKVIDNMTGRAIFQLK